MKATATLQLFMFPVKPRRFGQRQGRGKNLTNSVLEVFLDWPSRNLWNVNENPVPVHHTQLDRS